MEATDEDFATATEVLKTALQTYKGTMIPYPSLNPIAGTKYRIFNLDAATSGFLTYVPTLDARLFYSQYITDKTTGGIFTHSAGNIDLNANPLSDDAQAFTFELVDGTTDTYKIRTVAGSVDFNKYLYARGSGQDLHVTAADPNGQNWKAIYQKSVADVDYYAFYNADKNIYAFFDTANGQIRGTNALGGDAYLFGISKNDIPTSISNVKGNNIQIPSVSKGSLTIYTETAANIRVFDITGKILATYQSNGNVTIDMNYTNGLYIIVVDNEGEVSSHKVILNK